MKGKKLPDLFVQFKDGVAWGTYYKREHGKDDGDKFTVARYTPAKPAKVCRMRRVGMPESIDDYSESSCGLDTRGGRIKR